MALTDGPLKLAVCVLVVSSTISPPMSLDIQYKMRRARAIQFASAPALTQALANNLLIRMGRKAKHPVILQAVPLAPASRRIFRACILHSLTRDPLCCVLPVPCRSIRSVHVIRKKGLPDNPLGWLSSRLLSGAGPV